MKTEIEVKEFLGLLEKTINNLKNFPTNTNDKYLQDWLEAKATTLKWVLGDI